jgi:hypothetical protein
MLFFTNREAGSSSPSFSTGLIYNVKCKVPSGVQQVTVRTAQSPEFERILA